MAFLRRAAPAATAVWSARSAFLEAGRPVAVRSLLASPPVGSSFGNAGWKRFMSTKRGDPRARFRAYLDRSRSWVNEKSTQYSKLAEEFKKADDIIKSAVQAGQYLYIGTGVLFTGLIFVVDQRVKPKVDERCKLTEVKLAEEAKKNQEFQRRAVSDFHGHVATNQSSLNAIQYDLNKLHQHVNDNKDELKADINRLHEKLIAHKEEEMMHRQEILKASKFLELHGYLVVSVEDYTTLTEKVAEIDRRTAILNADQVMKSEEVLGVDATAVELSAEVVKPEEVLGVDATAIKLSAEVVKPEEVLGVDATAIKLSAEVVKPEEVLGVDATAIKLSAEVVKPEEVLGVDATAIKLSAENIVDVVPTNNVSLKTASSPPVEISLDVAPTGADGTASHKTQKTGDNVSEVHAPDDSEV